MKKGIQMILDKYHKEASQMEGYTIVNIADDIEEFERTHCADCGITLSHDEEIEDGKCLQCEAMTIINISKEDLDELKAIKDLLDEKLYDDMNLYEDGAKDILNYLFDRKGVDGELLENFKQMK